MNAQIIDLAARRGPTVRTQLANAFMGLSDYLPSPSFWSLRDAVFEAHQTLTDDAQVLALAIVLDEVKEALVVASSSRGGDAGCRNPDAVGNRGTNAS